MPFPRTIITSGVLGASFSAGYGVMFTMLDDFRDSYGIGEGALGAVVSIGFFASFFAQIVLAPLADRGHARRLVFWGVLGNLVGLLAMAYAKDFAVMAAARLVMGVSAGCAIPALRRIVILSDPDNTGRNLGLMLSADVGGFACGPVLAAILVGPFGLSSPFLVLAAFTLVTFPVVLRAEITETAAEDEPEARFAFDLLGNPGFVAAIVMAVALFIMIGTFDALWVLVLDDMDTSDWIANVGIAVFALPFIVFGSYGGRLAERVGPFRLATIGLTVGAVAMLAYGLAPSGGVMFVIALVHALNDGLTFSASSVAASRAVPPERQAGAQGLLGGAQTLTGGIVAVLAGGLYEQFGRLTAYGTGAALMAVCILIALVLVRRFQAADAKVAAATVSAGSSV
jgi:MFS family permease